MIEERLPDELIKKIKAMFKHTDDCNETTIYRMMPEDESSIEGMKDKLVFKCWECNKVAVYALERLK